MGPAESFMRISRLHHTKSSRLHKIKPVGDFKFGLNWNDWVFLEAVVLIFHCPLSWVQILKLSFPMQQREIQLCGCSSSEQQTCLLGLEEFRNLPFVVASKHPRFLTELQVVDSRVGGLSAFHQCASKARCQLQYSMGPEMTSRFLKNRRPSSHKLTCRYIPRGEDTK